MKRDSRVFRKKGKDIYVYKIPDDLPPHEPWTVLQYILEDPDVEEVFKNPGVPQLRVIHQKYGLCECTSEFSESQTNLIIDWLKDNGVSSKGDTSTHMVEGVMEEGHRYNAVLPPVSPRGVTLTIRRLSKEPITFIDLINNGTFTIELAAFLWLAADGMRHKPANMLIIGGTGCGKSTTLNSILQLIPPDQRILTLEDVPELVIDSPEWVQLTVPSIVAPKQSASWLDLLLINSLRMRPDRIVVGEVRGKEAYTLFTTMNTGHQGVLGTIHANSIRESIERLTQPPMNVPSQMLNSVDLLIFQRSRRGRSGVERIIGEVAELVGFEKEKPVFNTIFEYDLGRGVPRRTRVPSLYVENIARATGKQVHIIQENIRERSKVLKDLVARSARSEPATLNRKIKDYTRSIYMK